MARRSEAFAGLPLPRWLAAGLLAVIGMLIRVAADQRAGITQIDDSSAAPRARARRPQW